MDKNGNLGIGTNGSPSEKLEVIGNINSEGKLKENGHDLIPVGTIVTVSYTHLTLPTICSV